MKCVLTAIVLLAGSVLSTSVFAQADPVTSRLVARRVDTVDGKQVLLPADAVKPGDVVDYAATYRNGGAKAADKLVATIPVPAYTAYVSGSANPPAALASTDGNRFERIPLMRSVRAADGSTRQEPVPTADYKFIRWEIGSLAPAAEVTVRMRVRVDPLGTPAATSAPSGTRP